MFVSGSVESPKPCGYTSIETALAFTGGREKDAAQLLGWGRNTLTRKLQEYQMESQAL